MTWESWSHDLVAWEEPSFSAGVGGGPARANLRALRLTGPASPLLTKWLLAPSAPASQEVRRDLGVQGDADSCGLGTMISLESHSTAAFSTLQETLEGANPAQPT